MKKAQTLIPSRQSVRAIAVAVLSLAMASLISISLVSCAGSPLAGNWDGSVKLTPGRKVKSAGGYSETKVSLKSNLYLNGDGSYKAKLQEVSYTGDWKQDGHTVTLTPKTYMGMDQATFPAPKKDAGAGTVDKLFQPYKLDLSADGKTLTHTDDLATTTFSHSTD